MATDSVISAEELVKSRTREDWIAWIDAYVARGIGGCESCRFADPFTVEVCTLPDISAEDYELGAHGVNCSRWQAREGKPGLSSDPGYKEQVG